MRYASFVLLVFLILSLFANFEGVTPVEAQAETKTMGNASVPDVAFVNWTWFWSVFNAHSDWDLEYDDGSGWTSIKSDLQIIKNYTTDYGLPVNASDAVKCKITLNFTASYSADYRLTFGVDLDVKNYTHKTGALNYTLSYQNYTVYFDWSDIAEIPGIVLTHGIKPVGDESWFWFRARRDNVPQGANVVIDPTFGYDTAGGSATTINNQILGTIYTCSEAGTGKNITAYIKRWGTSKFTFALYEVGGGPPYTWIANTTEYLTPGPNWQVEGGGPSWVTLNFTSEPTLSAQNYVLVAWGGVAGCELYWNTYTLENGRYDSLTYGTYPSPWTPDGNNLYNCSIYVTYTTGAAPTEYNFSGTIPLIFSFNGEKAMSWLIQGAIPLAFTFNGAFSYSLANFLSFYGLIPLQFTLDTERLMQFGRGGSIPLTFTFDGAFAYSLANWLTFHGNIPLQFAFNTLKAISFSRGGSIPLQFTIESIAQALQPGILTFYGSIPLAFSIISTTLGLPTPAATALNWGIIGVGLAMLAFCLAAAALIIKKREEY